MACWGDFGSGVEAPGYVIDAAGARLRARDVDVGGKTACAVTEVGGLMCWGKVFTTNNTPLAHLAEVEVFASGIVDVAVGASAGCAIKAPGSVWCFGQRDLAPSALMPSTTPYLVSYAGESIADAIAIDLGATHACTRRRSGAVSCWGSNTAGQLGTGERGQEGEPLRIVALLP